MLLIFLFEAGQAACQILLPFAIKEIIDSLALATSGGQVFKPVYLFVALSFGILIFSRMSGALLVYVGPAMRKRSRAEIYKHLQHQSHRYFTSNFAGSLANRISEVSIGINHSLWTVAFDFWPVLITFGVSLYLLFQAHFELGLYLSVWIFLYVSISFALASRAQNYARSYAAARSKVSGKIVDSVSNIFNTKLFARFSHEIQNLDYHLQFEVDKGRESLWFMEKMRWFQFTFALILQVGILFFSVNLWRQDVLSVGSFTMVTSLSLLIINDARGLSRRFLEFFEYLGNISDGVSILMTDHEIVDSSHSKKLEIIRGEIEFKGVNFEYQEGSPIFKNLNLKINANERVGLVGFSGSGKSTFINLLLRLYEIQTGNIKIDGQDISKVTQNSLREKISLIPQDPILFHRSLLENIRYGDINATNDQVYEAARLAHAHDFILQQPDRYQSLVGERGVKLSGGQRQRIAIARAILKNAPILLLDEATSSLDSHTEKLIQKGIENLMIGKTVVVIAHRLSTISHLDRIIVFHNGEIVEMGSHEELLLCRNHYYNLWSMQAGGFLPDKPSEYSGTV